jgi:H+/Cl- antiporter ClcA
VTEDVTIADKTVRILAVAERAPEPASTYLHVVAVAVLGSVAVLVWLWVYATVNRLLWENGAVAGTPWIAPLITLPFALLTGLLAKYAKAPTSRDESLLETLSGDASRIETRLLPANVLIAWTSLFSGAVLGPEGGIGGIGAKLAALYADRVGIPASDRSRLVYATLAAAYNGLIASPVFTGVLATELEPDPTTRSRNLPANLIGGAIGFLVFHFVGLEGFRDYFAVSSSEPLRPVDAVIVVGLALVGLAAALVARVLLLAADAIFDRFEGREVMRALVGGLVFSIVGVLAPVLLFSGETQARSIVADPGAYGAAILVGMAIAKLALLAVALKSGFLGGPVFPMIFASVCVAEALVKLLPGVRADLLVGAVTAGFLTAVFRAPLMVVLLVALMLQASPELTAFILLAVATVLIVGPLAARAMAARRGTSAPSDPASSDAP